MNAFVPIPLVPLRTAPAETSEMCSQLLYGEQVEVLDTQPRWLHVRCRTDGYTGWCDRKMLQTLTPGMEDAFRQAQWRTVRTALCACLTRDGHRMWLPGGSRIPFIGTDAYPLGGVPLDVPAEALQPLPADGESIIRSAQQYLHAPYLWGGKSVMGIDCSGLVQVVHAMHGVALPRDASQQAYVGQHIDIAPDFGNLQPGDLLFFGRKATPGRKERIVHVGIYIGGKRFIHSQGDVRVGSLDPSDACFDEFNRGRLLFATRFLPYVDKEEGLNTTTTNPYYK